jgi:hypothetical protein
MRAFINVNPSIRCLLKVILSTSSRMEVGSVPKTQGVAGLIWNVAGTFASPLGYIPRFVLHRMLEDREMSS